MKYIFKNLKGFIKNERIIFALLLSCAFVTAFILNFAYGTYQNSIQANIVSDAELMSFRDKIDLNLDKRHSPFKLTKGDLRKYLIALKPETLAAIENILTNIDWNDWAECCGSKFENERLFSEWLGIRVVLCDGDFATPQWLTDLWYSEEMIVDGRWFTDEEVRSGAKVAVVPSEPTGYTPAELKEYQETYTVGNTVEINGEAYEIIGIFKTQGAMSLPFGVISDDYDLTNIQFFFSEPMTRRQYNDLKNTAARVIPGQLYFEDLRLPDDDTVLLNNNIILISGLIAALSALNFSILYLFVLRKRKNALAVMRLCGAASARAAFICLGECMALFVPAYWLGTLCFDLVMKGALADIFPYMLDAITPLSYACVFAVYLVIMLTVLGVTVARNVRFKISDCMREAKI